MITVDGLRSRARPFGMRPHLLVTPDPLLPSAVPAGTTAVVVGGGVAGVSAAVVLAERGVAVTLLEAKDHLGGRLGAWPHTLPDGTEQVVEHGFHAFFRHYYTWRDVLRRADPGLTFLRPIDGYPVISRQLPDEDITGLPAAPPLNLLTLIARSPSLRLSELAGVNIGLAAELLGYERRRTTMLLDDTSAAEFLGALGFTDRAKAMLFEAFARSFFCNQSAMSAAELVAMFHYYFLGNPEGIGFDAPDTDYLACIWSPLQAHLERLGATVCLGTPARSLLPAADGGWRVELDDGRYLDARHVVLALDPGGLRALVGSNQRLAAVAPLLAAQAGGLEVAPGFAVTRLWLERDVAPQRATFSAVSRQPTLDSITCYHRLERPSARWAVRTGGSVLELHSYSCPVPDTATATARMRAELAELWPETANAVVLHVQQRIEATAPLFAPGAAGTRPQVRTDARGVRVAGDFVELPFCAGLMERSAASGVLAANDVLAEVGAAAEPIRGIPQRGLLAGVLPTVRRR